MKKEIIHAFVAQLTKSICKIKNTEYPDDNYRNAKYRLKKGVALIIRVEQELVLQWHPFLLQDSDKYELDLLKGISTTSIRKMTVENDLLVIDTANSLYYFSLDSTKDVDNILKKNMVIRIYM